jgi:hypothetical protein
MNAHIVRSALCLTALGLAASCAAEGDPDRPGEEADQLDEDVPLDVDESVPTLPETAEAERFPAPQPESNLRAGCTFRNDYVTSVTVGEGYWGWWPTCFDWCPDAQQRSYAYSLWLKSEGLVGGADDSALNGVALDCYNKSDWAYRGYVQSQVGGFGGWTAAQYCAIQPVVGGEMKIESPQGSGDDTAANRLDAMCADGQWLEPQAYTSWGTWRGFVGCPAGTAVCGVKTRVELAGADDPSLNGGQCACCTFQVGRARCPRGHRVRGTRSRPAPGARRAAATSRRRCPARRHRPAASPQPGDQAHQRAGRGPNERLRSSRLGDMLLP